MQAVLAGDLQVPPARIGLKATTTEHRGRTGRAEGSAALAVVLIDDA